MERRLQNMIPSRRDVLKWGGLALAGACADGVVWPLQVRAAGKANPRGTARHAIMIELSGAIDPACTFDFKELKHTPKDLEPHNLTSDITMSKTLFPQLSDHIKKIAFSRTTKAGEVVHFTGQYHTQTGRALNIALAREIPALGSVIAYELESRRRPSDTFPTYVSAGLTTARMGAISSGFLPVRFTGLDLDPTTVFETFAGDSDNKAGQSAVLEYRWSVLQQFAKASEAERNSLGKNAADYDSFYEDARKLRFEPRWIETFKTTPEEKKRYGEGKTGSGCLMARNLIAADAGTHFVYVHSGEYWDHHANMLDHGNKKGLYSDCAALDKALSSLLEDLSKMPGQQPGKTLLDDTLVFVTSEFGRTPQMNPGGGTDHYPTVYPQLWAGGGVKGGRAIGKTDELLTKAVDIGWNHKQQPWMDNAVATIYSALGIDWMKEFTNTPSGRAYAYVQMAPVGIGGEFISNDEISPLFI